MTISMSDHQHDAASLDCNWKERLCSVTGRKLYTPVISDDLKPLKDMVLDSFDHAFAYYQRYALACGFSARKSTSYKSRDGLISLRYVLCSKAGSSNAKPVNSFDDESKKKVRRNRGSKRTGCNAHIKLSLLPDIKLKIYCFKEEHNHIFVEQEDVHFLPAARNLNFVQESFIAGMSAMNVGSVKSFNIMRTLYGGFGNVGASKVDCKNFKRDLNLYIGDYDAEMVVRLLVRKKECSTDFTYEYIVGEDHRLKGLYWADEVMKKNYQLFSDVVGFDATYRSNKYDLVFVSFTGIDNHAKNVTFGAALLGSETADSYKWLLQKFIDVGGKEPQVIVTDQDPAMKRVIKDVFPRIGHRLCMWHIWEKLKTKVSPGLAGNIDFNRRLCYIVWNDTLGPEVFETEWHSIISDFGLNNNEWLTTMFELRFDWIPAYYREEKRSGLMRTTSRCESENYFLDNFAIRNVHWLNFLLILRLLWSFKDMSIGLMTIKPDTSSLNFGVILFLKKQASELFTTTIFEDVQLVIEVAFSKCLCVSIHQWMGFKILKSRILISHARHFFKVHYRKEDDITVTCSYMRFEQLGLLCCHIFYVLRIGEVKEFPSKYVLKRWMREATPNIPIESNTHYDDNNNITAEIDKVVREITVQNEYLMNRLVGNLEELCVYREYLKSYTSKADEVFVTHPPPSRKDRFASITGTCERSHNFIHVPIKSRTKGCGSQKRLKTNREIAISKAFKIQKVCGVCGVSGHNSRTCKEKS